MNAFVLLALLALPMPSLRPKPADFTRSRAEVIAAAADREFVAKVRDLVKRQQEADEKGHKLDYGPELLDLIKKKFGLPKQ